jgi:uncharacterized protein
VKFRDYDGKGNFLSIVGSEELHKTCKLVIDYAKENNLTSTLSLIPQEVIHNFNSSEFEIIEDIDNHDYIVETVPLVILKSSEFRGKRSSVNNFLRNYGDKVTIQPLLMDDNITQQKILQLFDFWKNARNIPEEEWYSERAAIERIVKNHRNLGRIFGTGIFLKDDLIAFSIFEIQLNGQGILHFEKADSRYKGIYTYLNQQLAGTLLKHGVENFNYEQDLGIEGLRQAKELYHPVEKIKKYKIKLLS